ncbi:hypothetical protein BEH94_05975 [Candidatus Altiarchaeales archaeon WOR_SM1_SCG]|nr:hypothetical protein BEH94_05975 [Candidatus Altiarchaeales archaeon WOR_SM1_SCG]
MASKAISSVFERGFIKPPEKINLSEGERILIKIKKTPVDDMKGLIKLNPEKTKEAEEIINTDIELLL